MSAYIRRVVAKNVMKDWTIAVLTGDGVGSVELPGFPGFKPIKRSAEKRLEGEKSPDPLILNIKRVVNPRDEEVDITDDEWRRALMNTIKQWQTMPEANRTGTDEPTAPAAAKMRKERASSRGLLLIYPFSIEDAKIDKPGLREIDVLVGSAIFFPELDASLDRDCAVEYKVNNKYWDLEVLSDGV